MDIIQILLKRKKKECEAHCPLFIEAAQIPDNEVLANKAYQVTGLESLNPSVDMVTRISKLNSVGAQVELERVLGMPPITSAVPGLFLTEDEITRIEFFQERYKKVWFCGNNDEDQIILARIACGLLPFYIINQFLNRISGKTDKKFVFYSAHDTTIMSMLSQFGFKEFPSPNFAACIVLELHKIEEEYFVAIKYNHESPEVKVNFNKLRTHKMPLHQPTIAIDEAEEGMHTFAEFENYLLNTKQSSQTDDEWDKVAGGFKSTRE